MGSGGNWAFRILLLVVAATVVVVVLSKAGVLQSGTGPDRADWEAFDSPIGARGVSVKAVAADDAIWATASERTGSGPSVSQVGLLRFDGSEWTHIEIVGPIRQVVPSADGSVWVGSMVDAGGIRISKWDGSGWTALESDACNPADSRVRRFVVAPDGAVWAGCDLGLARFGSDGESVVMRHERVVEHIWIDPNGGVWASGWVPVTGAGWVSSWDGQAWTDHFDLQSTGTVGHLPPAFEQAVFAGDGSMWLVVGGQVWWFNDDGDWDHLQFPEQPMLLYADRNNTVWVRFEGQISAFDGSQWTHYGSAEGVPVGSTGVFVEARDGTLWAEARITEYTGGFTCVFGGGDCYDTETSWLVFNGEQWIASSEPSVDHYETQCSAGFSEFGCVVDSDGHIWIGGMGRIYRSRAPVTRDVP